MAYHFTPGQIFAPVLPITRRRTLAYILSRHDNTLTIAECGMVHTVDVQVNQAFGNEFVKVVGRDDDFVISAPCALSGLELREAQKQIAEQSRVLARGE